MKASKAVLKFLREAAAKGGRSKSTAKRLASKLNGLKHKGKP